MLAFVYGRRYWQTSKTGMAELSTYVHLFTCLCKFVFLAVASKTPCQVFCRFFLSSSLTVSTTEVVEDGTVDEPAATGKTTRMS